MKHVGSLPLQDVMHYEQLKAGVIQHYLLVDNLIYKVLVTSGEPLNLNE